MRISDWSSDVCSSDLIGLSFRDGTGRYCRSFEGDGLAGIGCREGSRWTLERTLRGETRPAYRQAASGDLAADAAAMMAGAPLDAAAERVARDKGWADWERSMIRGIGVACSRRPTRL